MEDRRWIDTRTVLALAQIEMSLSAIGNSFWLGCSSSGDPFVLLSFLSRRHIVVVRFAQTSVEILFVVYNPDVGLLGKVRMVCKHQIQSICTIII